MIEFTFSRVIGPASASIASGPQVNKCCKEASPCAAGRITPGASVSSPQHSVRARLQQTLEQGISDSLILCDGVR
ncbi:hypothetical protein, partial [Pseudomonas sp. GL-RE-19]|uniref:hypothetical protein n=1 Tax=Pseudomonas sp. GL-RE-19 TaxID=2832389 RepID=UPI001CC19F14